MNEEQAPSVISSREEIMPIVPTADSLLLGHPVMCPYCDAQHSCAIDPAYGALYPEKGSYNVCVVCNGVSKYDENLDLAPVSVAELDGLSKETKDNISAIQTGIEAARLRRQT